MRDVLMINVKGDVVRKFKMDPHTNNTINVSDIPSGVFYLKLVDDTIVLQKKFVKIN